MIIKFPLRKLAAHDAWVAQERELARVYVQCVLECYPALCEHAQEILVDASIRKATIDQFARMRA